MRSIEENFISSFRCAVYGDILGSVYEFSTRQDMDKVELSLENIQKNKVNFFCNPFGTYTDDTILMLAGMQSFIDCSYRYDEEDQIDKIYQYITDGRFSPTGKCFDIGSSTRLSVLEYIDNNKRDKWKRQGNGVLMKLAPYAFVAAKQNLPTIEFSKTVTQSTHSDNSITSTFLLMDYLVKSYRNEETPKYTKTGDFYHPEGFHQDSLRIAFESQDTSLEKTLINAIRLGGDTDTNACIAGMIYGAQSEPEFHLPLGDEAENILTTFIEGLRT